MVAPPSGRRGEAQAAKGRANRDRDTGGGVGLTDREKALINMGKVVPKKTKQFEATTSNLAKVAGTLIGAAAGPVGTALNAAVAGYSALTDPSFDALNPFEGRLPDVTRLQGEGQLRSPDTGEGDINALQPVLPQKKKQKVKPAGFTLLEGAGGSLLGS